MAVTNISAIRDRRYQWRYMQRGAPAPRWRGAAAGILGLGNIATETDYLTLADGFHPEGHALVQNAGAADRQAGWSFSFNWTKSLTQFTAALSEQTRRVVFEADDDAIAATIKLVIEERLSFTRRGKQGEEIEPCLPVICVHQHFANRLNEAHFHKHLDILNLGIRADSSTGSILSAPFYLHKMSIGAFYRAELAANLVRRLGLELRVDGNRFDVAGVSKRLCDDSSTRRKSILDRLKSKGFHSARAAEAATLSTRPAKNEGTLDEMMQEWKEFAAQHGLTETKAEALLYRVTPSYLAEGLTASLREGLEQIQYEKSYFSEMELIEKVCNVALKCGVSGTECLRGVEEILKRPEIVDLGHHNGFRQFTTQQNLEIEDRLVQQVAERKDDRRFILHEKLIQKFLDKHLPLDSSLTDDERLRNRDQRKAFEHLALQPGQVAVLQGYAGTGKNFVVKLYNQFLDENNFRTTAMALAGVAARNLQTSTGIESETLALRLEQIKKTTGEQIKHHAKQMVKAALNGPTFKLGAFNLTSRHVVFVDEASLLSAQQLDALAAYVFKAGAKLVLLGDHRQLPPIERGSPLNAIAREVGQYELTHITRQGLDHVDPRPTWARDVVKHLAHGEAKEAITLLAERGKVTVADDREKAIDALLKDWRAEGARDPKNSLILTVTNAEADLINARCQSLLLRARVEAGHGLPDGAKNGETTFLVGDRVRFTKKSRKLNIENSERGEVIAIAAKGKALIVRTDAGAEVVVNNKQYPHLKHGWASTVFSAQGTTVQFAYHMFGGRLSTSQLSYVMASRGSEQNRFYTDKHEAGDDLQGLIKQAGLDRSKKIARDLVPREPHKSLERHEQRPNL